MELPRSKSGATNPDGSISFPVVVADYQGERYLVSMLGQKANWVRNLRADNHGVLVRGRREDVTLVEDLSDNRAAILRRYLGLAAGARPFFTIDRRAPLTTSSESSISTPFFASPERFDAKARPGFGRDVVRGDLLPAMCAHQNRFGGVIAGLVVQHDRRTLGVRQVVVTPLHQDHDRREQIATGVGQSVLVTVRVARVGHFFQQSLVDQGAQTCGQRWARNLQVARQLAETANPEKRLAQDQQGPSLTHDLQGTRNGLTVEAM